MTADARRDPHTREHSDGELRCHCHRLLARVHGDHVVLRCPRCKRRAFLSLTGAPSRRTVSVRFEEHR